VAIYKYTARDAKGKIVKGETAGDSRYSALTALQTRGLTVVAIEEPKSIQMGPPSLPPTAIKKGRFVRRVNLTERALFCRQLAISVSSGISLRESLETIASDLDNATFRAILQRVLRRLDDGASFSIAIAGEENVFDRLFVSLVRGAEESGTMPETLNYLATTLERSDRLARKVRSILAYPAFIACFFVIVTVIMTVFVLPQFRDVFASFGGDLPALTKAVLKTNAFILGNSGLILSALALGVGGVLLYGRTPVGRLQYDTLWLKVPVVGECIKKLAVSRFCRNLGVMLRGGVPVAAAIEIASDILGNKAMEKTLLATRDRIVSGNDIASSLDPKTFPRLVVRMIGVGESSGRLPEVLEKVADVYEDQVESSITVAMSLFEPLIIIVFGSIVLVLVMAIYLPVFTVASHVR